MGEKLSKLLTGIFIFGILWFVIRTIVHLFLLNTFLVESTVDYAAPIPSTSLDYVVNIITSVITGILIILSLTKKV
ncbi:hypothetical protein [Cytobacillus firmus]|uniref:hypothetical protein n=1 Tax=Cytobacillus firmus TaxID=1399 RepID=UPI001CFCC6D4|nr:hypothetical protein [Cytobacillus firmus]